MRGRAARAVALGALVLLAACADGAAQGEPSGAAAERAPRAARGPATLDSARLAAVYEQAAALPKLRSLLVEWRGEVVGERYFGRATRTTPANIKSASKSVIAALVGIALAEGHLDSLRQPIGDLLRAETRGLDTAKRAITVEDLLTMRAGLASTSFDAYGSFVSSRDWVRHTLGRPMVAPRGGPMIYSTGSSHLLSAILTRATGTSTYRFAQRELARPLGIALRPWTTDPQGIYFGGNEMRMTPREMLAFGRLYLDDGRAPGGRRILPDGWVDSSWVPRGTSPWTGHAYGYGWWIREAHGHRAYFAWGYGGQFIFVVPDLRLVVVMTSDPDARSRDGGHLDALHDLFADGIVPAVGG